MVGIVDAAEEPDGRSPRGDRPRPGKLMDEVLGVAVSACSARYLVSVYWTAPPRERADAELQVLDALQSIALLSHPLAAVERVSPRPLPDLERLLPA